MTSAVSQATCKGLLPCVNNSLHKAHLRKQSGSSLAVVSGNLLAFWHMNVSGKSLRADHVEADTSLEQTPAEVAAHRPDARSSDSTANRRLGRRTALQTSRLIRALALVLFFLFPLLSIVQLRDTDGPWRRIAQTVRPSVITLMQEDGAASRCGVVIQSRPLRIATAGTASTSGLSSVIEGEKVSWSTILVDEDKKFTILQAHTDLHGETEGASSLVHSIPAARLDLEGAGRLPEDVKAALIGPRDLQVESLWVGVLRTPEPSAENALYRAHLLRHVPEVASVATSAAWAEEAGQIDARLQGAPFVDDQGHVVALYLDRDAHRARAVPIEFISRSLVFLHLQAAQ